VAPVDIVHAAESVLTLSVVWQLDRLGRSLRDLLDISEMLRERDVALRSLTDHIDTGTAAGRMLYAVLGAVAKFERTVAGMRAAKAAGRAYWPAACAHAGAGSGGEKDARSRRHSESRRPNLPRRTLDVVSYDRVNGAKSANTVILCAIVPRRML
jgi:DNA invertase Pin-like site-specific DNA recombinase